MPLDDLPSIDEHSVAIAAPPEAMWAVRRLLDGIKRSAERS